MALGNTYFYNRTIRKLVVSFGSLFNEINIVRKSANQATRFENFKVPLIYGPKERFLTQIISDPSLTKTINVSVPRISFEMTGMTYDSSRKLMSKMQNAGPRTGSNIATGVASQYVPVPYDYEFTLSIYVRNTEDGTQIIEQILPFFTPDYTLSLNLIPELTQKYDVPIILNSVSTTTDYEGGLQDGTTRLIIWDLSFTVKGYMFPAVRNSEIIRIANTNLFVDATTPEQQKVYVDTANGHGTYAENEVVRVANTSATGVVVKYTTQTGVADTAFLTLKDMTKVLEDNDVLVGDFSNASRTVTRMAQLYSAPVKVAKITIVPDPYNAEPDDDYGFTETLKEYPPNIL